MPDSPAADLLVSAGVLFHTLHYGLLAAGSPRCGLVAGTRDRRRSGRWRVLGIGVTGRVRAAAGRVAGARHDRGRGAAAAAASGPRRRTPWSPRPTLRRACWWRSSSPPSVPGRSPSRCCSCWTAGTWWSGPGIAVNAACAPGLGGLAHDRAAGLAAGVRARAGGRVRPGHGGLGAGRRGGRAWCCCGAPWARAHPRGALGPHRGRRWPVPVRAYARRVSRHRWPLLPFLGSPS